MRNQTERRFKEQMNAVINEQVEEVNTIFAKLESNLTEEELAHVQTLLAIGVRVMRKVHPRLVQEAALETEVKVYLSGK